VPLAEISRLPVCRECVGAMQPISGGLCTICGERLFSSHALSPAGDDDEPRCGLCRRIEPPFARAIAYGSYDGGLRELIHLLKYAGVRPAANVLGRMLAEAIAELQPHFADGHIADDQNADDQNADDRIAVIPVPLYRAKLRRREFNHAEVIARAAIKLSPDTIRLRLCPDVLVRKRETPSQTGLTRHQRRENVRGAFGVAQAEVVKGREVLVVDDVYTTGATVSECARVLRRAGATKVWVATVARTLKIAEQHVEIRLPDEADLEISGAQAVPLARAAGI
jgi:ComF family protein